MKIKDKLTPVLALKSLKHSLWLTIGKAEWPLAHFPAVWLFPQYFCLSSPLTSTSFFTCPLVTFRQKVSPGFQPPELQGGGWGGVSLRQRLGQPSPSRVFGEQITLGEPALEGLKGRNILTQGQGKLNKGLWNKMSGLRLECQLNIQALK